MVIAPQGRYEAHVDRALSRRLLGVGSWFVGMAGCTTEAWGSVVAAIHRGLREVLTSAKVGQAPTRTLAFRTPAP